MVGGGLRSFPPATGAPGSIWLLAWPWARPTAVQTFELRSHWVVKLEEITPDWADSAFVGVYSTQEFLDETILKSKCFWIRVCMCSDMITFFSLEGFYSTPLYE